MQFEKPKKSRKKSRHITNPRIKENIPCEICLLKRAVETHEVFNGSNRNKSIKYKAQMYLCSECHEDWHRHRIDVSRFKREHQLRIMKENDWNIEKFIQEFGKNHI